MDLISRTHGEQKGIAGNGHFDCTCYHPLFVFDQFGMPERCALRPGNVHSADNWRNVRRKPRDGPRPGTVAAPSGRKV